MDLREQLATYSHGAWAQWMKYFFSKCPTSRQPHSNSIWAEMPEELYKRWIYQMQTDYADLPEDMKPSDRAEADKIIALAVAEVERQIDLMAAEVESKRTGESDAWRDGVNHGFNTAVGRVKQLLRDLKGA